MRRALMTALAAGAISMFTAVATAAPALACGGLVAPNGTIRLLRTSTLAAYHAGLEHYITSFQFAGDGAELGSIVPLPGIPSKVERGGDWTLQRLEREVQPPVRFATAGAALGSSEKSAQVVYQTKIDALDITILKGGGREVGKWATDHGYALTPDAPATLEFYSRRSPIFMAARFDAQAARERGQSSGDGTPIHLTIPTRNPWVPLRILGLGRSGQEQIDANVFLLTDRRPALLPGEVPGLDLRRDEPASESLLTDLRNDKGMEWMPSSMWLTYLAVGETAGKLRYDLAVDASGRGKPSYTAAGLRPPRPPTTTTAPTTTTTAPPTTTTAAPTTTTTPQVALPLQRAGHDRPGWVGAAGVALLGGAVAGGGALYLPRLRRRVAGR